MSALQSPDLPPRGPNKVSMPNSIRWFLIAVLVLFTYSLTRIPRALKAGVSFEVGKRALDNDDYQLATPNLRIASSTYPDSIDCQVALCYALVSTGHFEEAETHIKAIKDESLSREDIRIISDLQKAILQSKSNSPRTNK
jgi:thioredoxin-like negative regulator of GroEL